MSDEQTQATPSTETPVVDWKCNTCDQTEGVENGICPKCGPTQTTPISAAAKEEAGVVEEKEEEEVNEEEQPAGSETK